MGLTREGWPNIGSNGSDVFGGVDEDICGFVEDVCSLVSPRPTVAWVDEVFCKLKLLLQQLEPAETEAVSSATEAVFSATLTHIPL